MPWRHARMHARMVRQPACGVPHGIVVPFHSSMTGAPPSRHWLKLSSRLTQSKLSLQHGLAKSKSVPAHCRLSATHSPSQAAEFPATGEAGTAGTVGVSGPTTTAGSGDAGGGGGGGEGSDSGGGGCGALGAGESPSGGANGGCGGSSGVVNSGGIG